MAACKVRERQPVLALCDAIQIAIAAGQCGRVAMLLKEMHAIVDSALARRRETPLPIAREHAGEPVSGSGRRAVRDR
jgi:hypothetical protein